MIPDDLKIYSFIYEYRFWVLHPLYAAWLLGGIYLLFRVKKIFFLWLLIFPLLLQPLNIAFIYCGWHYRMELRERFARTDRGWNDSYTSGCININLMPSAVRTEYARHDYHPRFRDMKAMIAGTIAFTPMIYIVGGLAFITNGLLRRFFRKRIKQADHPHAYDGK